MRFWKLLPVLALVATVGAPITGVAGAAAAKHKPRKLLVCRRGCPYNSIQKAVSAARKGATVRIKPGRYVEGVTVSGHAKDGLTIEGLGTKPGEVVLEGKGARTGDGNPSQNGVFGDSVDNLKVRNLTARDFPANGILFKGAHGYLADHVIATDNRAYGVYAFDSIGGRMQYSEASGSGDSGFYVGQTIQQSSPQRTVLTHLTAFENVIGYSGTNAKYIDITNSEFFNNGAGVAPNTLSSEKYAPAADSTIVRNLIYWNNLNYYRADSPVKPITTNEGNSGATSLINLPTGIGVLLLGTTNVTVRANDIFGNFKWGFLAVSDPTYAAAVTVGNRLIYNLMGAAFDDANGKDVIYDGSGSRNCFDNNSPGTTFDSGGLPDALEYPRCANPTNVQDPVNGVKILQYFGQTTKQEDSWSKHPHPPIEGRKPIDGMGG